MFLESLSCPGCSSKLRRAPDLEPGDSVRCPRCDHTFAVPADAATSPRSTSDEPAVLPYKMRRVVEEMDRQLADDVSRLSHLEAPTYSNGEVAESTYVVSIGHWFTLAAENWGAILPMFLVYAVMLSIGFIMACFVIAELPILVLLLPFVLVPIFQGPMAVSLSQLRGKEWGFGVFFAGYNQMGSILGFYFLTGVLVVMIPYIFILGAFTLPSYALEKYEPVWRIWEAWHVEPLAFVLMTFLALAVYTRIGTFGPQLILHRQCSATDAIRGSWRLSRGRFWRLFGFQILSVLLNFTDLCLGGVAMLFTLPLTQLASAAAYLHAVGELPGPTRSHREPSVDD